MPTSSLTPVAERVSHAELHDPILRPRPRVGGGGAGERGSESALRQQSTDAGRVVLGLRVESSVRRVGRSGDASFAVAWWCRELGTLLRPA